MLISFSKDLYIAIIGGTDNRPTGGHGRKISEVEVLEIEQDGVVSTSSCQLPSISVNNAEGAKLLLCGGFPASKKCHRFNSDDWKWEKTSPMTKKRRNHAIATANDIIYVCGGYEGWGRLLNSCEKYDGNVGIWETIQSPSPLAWACMVALDNDTLLTIGGNDGSWVRI